MVVQYNMTNCCCDDIVECNPCCESYCGPCYVNTCDDCIELCIDSCTRVKICKTALHNVICCTIKHSYKIVGALLIAKTVYIFIQSGYKTKKNKLYIICGTAIKCPTACPTTYTVDECSLMICMYYNLYTSCNNYKIKVAQVAYNKYSDKFIILLCVNGKKTYIGQIDNYASTHTIGPLLKLVTKGCDVLCINNIPKCICTLSLKKYKVVVYDCKLKRDVGYFLCFE